MKTITLDWSIVRNIYQTSVERTISLRNEIVLYVFVGGISPESDVCSSNISGTNDFSRNKIVLYVLIGGISPESCNDQRCKIKTKITGIFSCKVYPYIASQDLFSAFLDCLYTLVAYIANNMDSDQKGA